MERGVPAAHLATGTARLGYLLQSRRRASPIPLEAVRDSAKSARRSLSIQEGDATLAAQFHPKNAPLSPEDIRLGSHKEIMWLCQCKKCGHPHEWVASPERRFILGNGCPICSGAKPCRCTALAALQPELLSQWDWEGNGDLTPWDVGISSHKGVKWVCDKHKSGHRWTATPKNRCRGSGCPLCGKVARQSKSVRPLMSVAAPHLLEEFAPELNGALDPETLTTGSGRKVWWQCRSGCSNCGRHHNWQAVVSDRTIKNSGCPICAGQKPCVCNSLATLHPVMVKSQWDAQRNDPLQPQDLLPRSQRKVWWQCSSHQPPWSWQAAPDTRTGPLHTGCPECGRRTRMKIPRLREAQPVQA